MAATFASEFNIPFTPLDTAKTQYERVAAAVAAAGRPAQSIVYSAAFALCVGRDDAEVTRRAESIGRDLDELRANSPLVGIPAEVVDKLGAWSTIGLQRVYPQMLDMSDLAHLELFAAQVMPQLG